MSAAGMVAQLIYGIAVKVDQNSSIAVKHTQTNVQAHTCVLVTHTPKNVWCAEQEHHDFDEKIFASVGRTWVSYACRRTSNNQQIGTKFENIGCLDFQLLAACS